MSEALVTPENIAATMEANRKIYITSIENSIKPAIEETFSGLVLAVEALFLELEAGSRELMLLRELYFLVASGKVDKEVWLDLNSRLKEVHAKKATDKQEFDSRLLLLKTPKN